ncbi:MAG: hypothetical protein ABIV36_07130 [Sphingobium limneticum]
MGIKLASIAVGAAGGAISGSALLACYFVASAKANGADGGDWLSFAGVFFGVAATIGGTLGIESIRERMRHGRAVSDLDAALSIWIETSGRARIALGRDVLADLREQIAYISAISADLSRSKRAAVAGTHNFNFHAPSMIKHLEEAMTMLADNRQTFITYITGEMVSYAETMRRVLHAK